MMKFWKSAAKGKTGCPVRPPEPNTSSVNTNDIRPLLDTQLEDKEDQPLNIFEKKSKLCLSLRDILIEKNALKHFIQFMETIGKHLLVKCWLELDNFKKLVSNSLENHSSDLESHLKISRAKSFDFQCKCEVQKDKELVRQGHSWKDSGDRHYNASNFKRKTDNTSTSSCLNLAEYENSFNICYECENKNRFINLTEIAIDLFKKYVALEAPCHLDLPDSLRKSVISNICNPEGIIKEDCFKTVQDVLLEQIDNNYFSDFLNSPYYMKAQIDILTNGSLNLKDILYNDTILFYFTEYLEQESCRIWLEFLMAVTHFRDNLMKDNLNPEQAQADAIVLYDKYFSLQATSPVGFDTDIRLQVESDICLEGGPLPTCFDLPYKIVFKSLTRYVKTFLESELYYKYLSEMIHSVDQMWTSNHRSQSDCSSEFSISTQNTLLAMGDPVFRKKKRNHSVPDMTIDSNQLYNADALWQRKRYDGLSLGRVNSLGRFESKFEPNPDRKDKSVLRKMVSRFVPTSTTKVEEEMAWQIAHMIVKDVTDLTMAPPENEHDVNVNM